MKAFDTDGDGKLSDTERAEMKSTLGNDNKGKGRPAKPAGLKAPGGPATPHKKIIEQFDANGNGKLEPDEQAAARQAAKQRRDKKAANDAAGPNGLNGFQPGNGIGGLNGTNPGGAGNGGGDGRQKLLQKFDLNRDGQLSQQEMAQAHQMMERLRASGQSGEINLPPGGQVPGVGRPNIRPPQPFRQ